MANKMSREEKRAMNAAAKKAEKDARERRKSSQNPDTSAPDDEFSNPAPDPNDVLNQNGVPDVDDPPAADFPAPNAPDAAPESDGGQVVKITTPVFPFPERNVYLWIFVKKGDPNDKSELPPHLKRKKDGSLFVLQDFWTFFNNTETMLQRAGDDGSWIDYLIGLEKMGNLEVDVKYVNAKGDPIYDLEVPPEVADVNKEDFWRLVSLAQGKYVSPTIDKANLLIASSNPDQFEAAINQMSDAELSSYTASMKQVMKFASQDSDSGKPTQPSPQPSPTEDPPTQP